MKHYKRTLLSLALIAATGAASADEASSALQLQGPHYGDNGWDVAVGGGIGISDGSVYVGEDEDEVGISLLGHATYQNDNFYFTLDDTQGLAVGYTVLRGENWAFDGVLSPKMAAYFEDSDNEELEHLDDRRIDLHLGGRLTYYTENGRLGAEISNDISGAHDGAIVSLDYQHEWQVKNWVLGAKLGAAYLSEDISDYYFGVSDDEATARYPAHEVGAGVVYNVGLRAEYPITEHWVFQADASAMQLSDEIDDSPITDDQTISLVSAGVKYKF